MQFMASLVDAVCLVSGMTEATVVEMPKRTRGLQNLSKIEIQADAPFSSIYSIFSHSFKQKKSMITVVLLDLYQMESSHIGNRHE